jgi:uncharacterized membrane protein (UPF0127 family)
MARILVALLLLCATAGAGARNLDSEFEKAAFKIGRKKISAYVADTDEKRARGLMFIEKLPEDTGMIFVFEHPRILSFWMKDTLIPLSIGFFDRKGVLIDVQKMTVTSTLMTTAVPSYASKGEALFALEMNSGWFAKHKIHAGAQLKLVSNVKSRLLNAKIKTK